MKKISPMRSFVSFLVACCLFINLSAYPMLSQTREDTPPPTPTPASIDPELQKLKDRNAILEEQKKAADLEKALNDAKFPKPTATPLAGDTVIDSGVKIESEMMAYVALKKVADEVSKEVIKNRGEQATTLAILNDQWLTGIKSYWATRNQMKLMKNSYDTKLSPPRPPLFAARISETGIMADVFHQQISPLAWIKKENQNLLNSIQLQTVEAKSLSAENNETNNSSDSGNGPGFDGLAAGVSTFGIAGSIVGAFIDVAALMRTDTKITGSSFVVQDSALVSEVYRRLGKKDSGYTNLYYPAEFSPNINIQSDFIILKEIQTLFETKSHAEQLVTEIEEVEKVLKEAVTAKDALEARQKQLPDLITAAERELKKNQSIYKNRKFRSAELLAKIKDGENAIADLVKERDVDLPKKIEKNKKAIAILELRLSKLYDQINTVKPAIDLVESTRKVAASLDEVSNALLNRNYKLDELAKLSEGDKETKEALIKEAKSRGQLSAVDEARLIQPIEPERARIFLKIAHSIEGRPDLFIHDVLSNLLSDGERMKLFYPEDEQVNVAKQILERSKGSSTARLKVLNKQFDKFFEDIVKVDPASGLNPITSHLQTENLLIAFGCDMGTGACDSANALVLKVVDVGGNNRVKKNLITMVATGDNVSHSGGAIIEFKMYSLTGRILTSSVCSAYESYRKAKDINASTESTARCSVNGVEDGDTNKADDSKTAKGKGKIKKSAESLARN